MSYGSTEKESLLYGTPGGAIVVVSLVPWGLITQRYGSRLVWGTVGIGLATLGSILIVALPLSSRGGRLAGLYLTGTFVTGTITLVSLISSNVVG